MIARVRAALPRVLRFGAVGATNTIVDLGVLNLLLYFFAHGDAHARVFPYFATISFLAATLNSYALNRAWTFRDAARSTTSGELSRFYLVTGASFLVNVGISSFLVWLSPFPGLNATLWANVAKLTATGISLVLNFVGYQRLVFSKR